MYEELAILALFVFLYSLRPSLSHSIKRLVCLSGFT